MNALMKSALKMPSVRTQTARIHVAVRKASKAMVLSVQVCDHFS